MLLAETPTEPGLLFHADGGTGLSGCPRCGWSGVPTSVGGVRQDTCPVCEDGAETVRMWDARAELFDPRPKVGRNQPCWCGSGVKFKKCHGRPT